MRYRSNYLLCFNSFSHSDIQFLNCFHVKDSSLLEYFALFTLVKTLSMWNILGQEIKDDINPLAPSDPYMGRTAQLTSRRCI
jgi:hypothetical protein